MQNAKNNNSQTKKAQKKYTKQTDENKKVFLNPA